MLRKSDAAKLRVTGIHKGEHVFRGVPDVLDILCLTPPVLLARQQVGGAAYRGQRGTQVVGDGKHHVLLGLQELSVGIVGDFQLLLVAVFAFQVPVYDKIQDNGEQRDGNGQDGYRMERPVALHHEPAVAFFYPEGRFRLQFLDDAAQPPVQPGIVLIQQVHLEQQALFLGLLDIRHLPA